MPLFWRVLKNPRLWDPNAKRLSQKIRRNNSLPRSLKERNQKSTIGIPELRWGVITSMRCMYMLNRIA